MSSEHSNNHPKMVTIIINGTAKQVTKGKISYEEIIALAFDNPPTGENVQFTVQYTRGQSGKTKGTLVAGQSVEVVEGMEFDVTATNRS